MTKSLILHIGWRKTGSTALQKFVFDNTRGDRLQHLGIVPAGRVEQDRVIGGQVTAHHGLGGLSFRARCDQAWKAAMPFFEAPDTQTFLVSSEVISSHLMRGGGHFERLAEYLSPFDRVRILCWLRRQDDYVASLAVQAAKHGGNGRERGDREPANWPKDADYNAVLERLATVLPHAEILPRLYGGAGNDVTVEAIRLLDLDVSRLVTVSPGRVNSRVSPEMYRMQIEVNRRAKARGIKTGPLQRVLLDAVAANPELLAGAPAAVPFTREHRWRILERHRKSNQRLCESYGFDAAYFEPSFGQLAEAPDFNIPDRITAEFAAGLADAIERVGTVSAATEVEFIRSCLGEFTEHG